MTREAYRPPEYTIDQVQRAITRLKSFQDGDVAVQEVVSLGDRALPSLRDLLFSREPSGLYQTRVRAIDALARLGAKCILIEFLQLQRVIDDPIERLGEDAVINAAARAVAHVQDQLLLELLKRLAQRPCLSGVIFALGASGREEAIPFLIDALGEDESRLTAEAALRKMGSLARDALVKTATRATSRDESESRRRQRRSALGLLTCLDISDSAWRTLRPLMTDEDAHIALTACELAFRNGSTLERRGAVLRLLNLYRDARWIMREDIEQCLNAHTALVKEAVQHSAELQSLHTGPRDPSLGDLLLRLDCHARTQNDAHV